MFAAALAALLAGPAGAAPALGINHDPDKALALARTIPLGDKTLAETNLAERFNALAILPTRTEARKFSKDDIELDPVRSRKGDVHVQFSTSEIPEQVRAQCPIWTSFSMVYRSGQWLPRDRTSNFLLNGKKGCVAPP
ncbi:hypothetical protein [Paracidovorax citrulli]|uniref:hypothetical protein n=1 Tax=Paracidovorax citrulli TaxID=80869 RepID=UPI0005FB3A00|nr:hypothetical protein [Paracidovorax citrulli]